MEQVKNITCPKYLRIIIIIIISFRKPVPVYLTSFTFPTFDFCYLAVYGFPLKVM